MRPQARSLYRPSARALNQKTRPQPRTSPVARKAFSFSRNSFPTSKIHIFGIPNPNLSKPDPKAL
jgi:hypothetical protein